MLYSSKSHNPKFVIQNQWRMGKRVANSCVLCTSPLTLRLCQRICCGLCKLAQHPSFIVSQQLLAYGAMLRRVRCNALHYFHPVCFSKLVNKSTACRISWKCPNDCALVSLIIGWWWPVPPNCMGGCHKIRPIPIRCCAQALSCCIYQTAPKTGRKTAA